MNIFVTGGTGGVGRAVVEHFATEHNVTAPGRHDLNLFDFASIDNLDLSGYDVVVNCAGANPGAYQGWHKNSWPNQVMQVNVNFTSVLLLAKRYTQQRKTGQFIYITSTNIDDPISYNIFYTGAKAALRYSMNVIKKDFPSITFTEICPGKIRTNMLAQNYQGAKNQEEIESMYQQSPVLLPQDIVRVIDQAIKYKLDAITISPHE